MRIQGGRALIGGQIVDADVTIDEDSGRIGAIGSDASKGRAVLNAQGCLVLPGIVDIHADAFERQLMPRPGVIFPIDVALIDSDTQAVANGITTLFHGLTWSWEPGLRGAANARAVVDAIESLRPRLSADTHCHLRHEAFNLDAEADVIGWAIERRISMIGFNDHMPSPEAPPRTRKMSQMAERSGLSLDDFKALVGRLASRAGEVGESIRRIAKAASAAGVPSLSHDDASPQMRACFRELGCRVAEFPTTVETAEAAFEAGDDIVLGAPNVLRGGSHIGWINAGDMIARGFCTVLASDYYYPAPLLAAFRLAAEGIAPFERAWQLVSDNPARAAKLVDRGKIEEGLRGDVIVVDAVCPTRPRLIAAAVNGRLVYITEPRRLS